MCREQKATHDNKTATAAKSHLSSSPKPKPDPEADQSQETKEHGHGGLPLLQTSFSPSTASSPFYLVLRTPDFRNCKAADEIQKQVKLLMALHKQITMDTGTKKKYASEHQQHLSHERLPAKEDKDELPAQQVQKQLPSAKWAHFIPENTSFVISQLPGSYIVGSSVFGWNFITFSGSKPVYYGVTKESYRSSHIKSGDATMLSTDGSSEQGSLPMSGDSTMLSTDGSRKTTYVASRITQQVCRCNGI